MISRENETSQRYSKSKLRSDLDTRNTLYFYPNFKRRLGEHNILTVLSLFVWLLSPPRDGGKHPNLRVFAAIGHARRCSSIGDFPDGPRSFSSDSFCYACNFIGFHRGSSLKNTAQSHWWIRRALVTGVSLGFANLRLGYLADRYSLSKFSTVGIFFLSGLMLRSQEIGAAVEAWPAGILGLVSILFLTPFFSLVILQVHLNPREFVTGLAIFCCMPTTLSSGVALTQLVGGNSALALAMTVISNFLGTMTVPISLALFVGGVGVSIPTVQLFKSLVMTLLVPLALGKVLRDFIKSVAVCVDKNRQYLSMTSAILLSLVPWMQVSRSKSLLLTVRPEVFATAVSMGVLLHIILLALNTFAVRILSMLSGDEQSILAKRENACAVIIVASQKTLPVMVAVVEQLRGALGEPGLLVLPCVAAHINQIIIDSLLVNWWTKDQRSTTTKDA
ncbi:probable sodium/metabolite cotransporter BASS4, chloroplastic [Phalaenopsis equestris]|uniref:probable sodium/metabolite cotransporter BASS4, chloroplastic n=1 Tax=Phalaenopsis equestris TaxID=78828 RepID=UPI0009E365E3|nr:probable sodium/metabolite cotransporter BASS4, chloroplastic [Phalaenopsis equestris]